MLHGADHHVATPRRRASGATAALLIGAVALLAFIPTCSPSSTTSSSSVTLPEQNPAELATCVADAQTLAEALDTYMAEKAGYPAPPALCSAATYAGNYQPLTAPSGGGSFLKSPPGTKHYVIEYDSAGHIWIAPPGIYGPYNRGQDFDADPNICDAAVG